MVVGRMILSCCGPADQGPDPELIPPGYQAAAGDDWTCLAGYVGRAQKVCPCGGDVSFLGSDSLGL